MSESLNPLWKNEAFHTAIELSIFIHGHQNPNDFEYEEVFEYQKANYVNIKRRLDNINWQSTLRNEGNVENAVNLFYNIIFKIIHDEVPKKKKRRNVNFKYPVWYNKQIKNLKNRKQKAHKIYKKNNCDENLEKYLDIANQLNFAIDTAFEEYNAKTENEIKSCPKNFFNYVKTNLKSDNFPSSMNLDEHVGNNPDEICNLFASFFPRNLHHLFRS